MSSRSPRGRSDTGMASTHDPNHLGRKVVIQHEQICNTSRAAEAATRQKPTDCGSVSAVPICRWFIVPATILSQLRHSRDPFAQDTPASEPIGASPCAAPDSVCSWARFVAVRVKRRFPACEPLAVLAGQPPAIGSPPAPPRCSRFGPANRLFLL